jgi:hypothetical protein
MAGPQPKGVESGRYQSALCGREHPIVPLDRGTLARVADAEAPLSPIREHTVTSAAVDCARRLQGLRAASALKSPEWLAAQSQDLGRAV